jgi:phosphoribosylformylglycinamidine synthase
MRILDGDEVVGDIPVTALVDDCPVYELQPSPPPTPIYPSPIARIAPDLGALDTLRALLGSGNIASRRWVFGQYDWLVGSRTVRRPEEADAAVLVLEAGPPTRRPAGEDGPWPPTPIGAPSRPWSSAARTSPAWAPSRSAPPTA